MEKLNTEITRFLLVGGSAFIVDFLILNFLVYMLGFQTRLFGYILVANVTSAAVAVLYGFILQKKWTFKRVQNNDIRREFIGFASLQVFNIVFYNVLVFNILNETLRVPIPVSKIIVACSQAITSYMIMRHIIFVNKQALTDQT